MPFKIVRFKELHYLCRKQSTLCIRHQGGSHYTNSYFHNYSSTATTNTGIHRHFFIVKEALCQVSEKCSLFHTRMHIFPWKLEISRAVRLYSTTKVVSYREDLAFQNQTTETRLLQQQYFTIKTPYIQCNRNSNSLLAFQFYKCLLFSNVCLLHLSQNKMQLQTKNQKRLRKTKQQ